METIDILKNLGFTEYEAKAYLALLSHSPSTGYAVAKNSGVPRSKIYEVLDSLTDRGDILVSPGATPLYQAVPPKELIASRKAKAEETYDKAELMLSRFVNAAQDRDNIWNITGHDAIMKKVGECIDAANQRILIEIWGEDYLELADKLKAAAYRGVCVTIIGYGPIDADFANLYLHDMSEEITTEYGGRWVVFSADDSGVVAGVISLGDDSRAAFTMHQGLVMPITEVIIHDLYIAEIMKEHRTVLEKTFGKNLVDLRNKFAIHPDHKKHYIE